MLHTFCSRIVLHVEQTSFVIRRRTIIFFCCQWRNNGVRLPCDSQSHCENRTADCLFPVIVAFFPTFFLWILLFKPLSTMHSWRACNIHIIIKWVNFTQTHKESHFKINWFWNSIFINLKLWFSDKISSLQKNVGNRQTHLKQ